MILARVRNWSHPEGEKGQCSIHKASQSPKMSEIYLPMLDNDTKVFRSKKNKNLTGKYFYFQKAEIVSQVLILNIFRFFMKSIWYLMLRTLVKCVHSVNVQQNPRHLAAKQSLDEKLRRNYVFSVTAQALYNVKRTNSWLTNWFLSSGLGCSSIEEITGSLVAHRSQYLSKMWSLIVYNLDSVVKMSSEWSFLVLYLNIWS